MQKTFTLLLPLLGLLGCSQPAAEVLRRQPPPVLYLELALPETPDAATMKRAYVSSFHDLFGPSLVVNAEKTPADRLQLLVVVGQRTLHTETEARLNEGVDTAHAIATLSPVGLVHSALGRKGFYEEQVQRLGYRPCEVSGQVIVTRQGKGGFQTTLKVYPTPILKHMRPLGESGRTTEGMLLEEGRAVALETLLVLKKELGWVPPPAS